MFRRNSGYARGLAITLCVVALLVAGALWVLDFIDDQSARAEEELVRGAVRQAMIACYAVEGAYPADVSYLKEHYGLAYNEDEYFVSYDAFASNILPEIHVTRKGAGA